MIVTHNLQQAYRVADHVPSCTSASSSSTGRPRRSSAPARHAHARLRGAEPSDEPGAGGVAIVATAGALLLAAASRRRTRAGAGASSDTAFKARACRWEVDPGVKVVATGRSRTDGTASVIVVRNSTPRAQPRSRRCSTSRAPKGAASFATTPPGSTPPSPSCRPAAARHVHLGQARSRRAHHGALPTLEVGMAAPPPAQVPEVGSARPSSARPDERHRRRRLAINAATRCSSEADRLLRGPQGPEGRRRGALPDREGQARQARLLPRLASSAPRGARLEVAATPDGAALRGTDGHDRDTAHTTARSARRAPARRQPGRARRRPALLPELGHRRAEARVPLVEVLAGGALRRCDTPPGPTAPPRARAAAPVAGHAAGPVTP